MWRLLPVLLLVACERASDERAIDPWATVLIGKETVGASCAFTLGVDEPRDISIKGAMDVVKARGGGNVCIPPGTLLEVKR